MGDWRLMLGAVLAAMLFGGLVSYRVTAASFESRADCIKAMASAEILEPAPEQWPRRVTRR